MKYEFVNVDALHRASIILAHPDGFEVIYVEAGKNVTVDLNKWQAKCVDNMRIRLLGMGILVIVKI